MDPKIAQVGLPSALGAGTSHALAKLYDFFANNGTVNGTSLFSEETAQLLQAPITQGLENMFIAYIPLSRGLFVKTNERVG